MHKAASTIRSCGTIWPQTTRAMARTPASAIRAASSSSTLRADKDEAYAMVRGGPGAGAPTDPREP
jgi:hypothetical protein